MSMPIPGSIEMTALGTTPSDCRERSGLSPAGRSTGRRAAGIQRREVWDTDGCAPPGPRTGTMARLQAWPEC